MPAIAVALAGCYQLEELSAVTLASDILAAEGIRHSLVVHVGCGEGMLIRALADGGARVVHGIDTDSSMVDAARRYLSGHEGGGRVAVARWRGGNRLPYATNTVNLLVVSDVAGVMRAGLSMEEIERVLAPYGSAFLGGIGDIEQVERFAERHEVDSYGTESLGGGVWMRIEEPYPSGMDEWRQYRHDAGRSAVSTDTFLAPPNAVRWIDGPLFSKLWAPVMSVVSAGGRVFYVEFPWVGDEHPSYTLEARDAFNGVLLWERPVWVIPGTRVPVAASKDLVFTRLDSAGPLVALNAADGGRVREYDGAGEFVLYDSLVVLRKDARTWVVADTATGTVRRQFLGDWVGWPGGTIDSVDILRTFEIVPEPPLLAARERLFLPRQVADDSMRIVSYDIHEGAQLWESETRGTEQLLCCVRDFLFTFGALDERRRRSLHAYDATTGDCLWSYSTVAKKGGAVAAFFIGDTLWVYDRVYIGEDGTYSPDSVASVRRNIGYVALDPSTGERIGVDEGLWKNFGRCAQDLATERVVLGLGFAIYDLRGGGVAGCRITRGDCGFGYCPANGMFYNGGNQCACVPYVRGRIAIAADSLAMSDALAQAWSSSHMEPGPAYGEGSSDGAGVDEDQWPMYRHDARRSAVTHIHVPASLSVAWRTSVAEKVSAPVVADGAVYVADVDGHRVCAVSLDSGALQWAYRAGGRIDTPPTVVGGLVVFGARDGWVYCVRAADGVLVWRRRAAPIDQRIVVRGQMESSWPVNGSVLVIDSTAYVSAGRHGDADSGIFVQALHVVSGAVLWRKRIRAFPPVRTDHHAYDIAGRRRHGHRQNATYNDILISDGTTLFLGALGIDLDSRTLSATPPGEALFGNVGSFLYDNTQASTGMSVRFEWCYLGENWTSAWRRSKGRHDVSGNVLAVGDSLIYGVSHSEYLNQWTKSDSNRFSEVFAFRGRGATEEMAEGELVRGGVEVWRTRHDTGNILLKSILATDEYVFVGCQPGGALVGSADTVAGQVRAYAVEDGSLVSMLDIGREPLFDGLAAVEGRIVIAMEGGEVVCLEGQSRDP